jgi:hypothetical protein
MSAGQVAVAKGSKYNVSPKALTRFETDFPFFERCFLGVTGISLFVLSPVFGFALITGGLSFAKFPCEKAELANKSPKTNVAGSLCVKILKFMVQLLKTGCNIKTFFRRNPQLPNFHLT